MRFLYKNILFIVKVPQGGSIIYWMSFLSSHSMPIVYSEWDYCSPFYRYKNRKELSKIQGLTHIC